MATTASIASNSEPSPSKYDYLIPIFIHEISHDKAQPPATTATTATTATSTSPTTTAPASESSSSSSPQLDTIYSNAPASSQGETAPPPAHAAELSWAAIDSILGNRVDKKKCFVNYGFTKEAAAFASPLQEVIYQVRKAGFWFDPRSKAKKLINQQKSNFVFFFSDRQFSLLQHYQQR